MALSFGNKRDVSAAEIFDGVFRDRAREHPEMLSLEFWAMQPCTLEARYPGVLGRRVLDVGCGSGEIDIHLARSGFDVTAYDISPVGLRIAEEHRRDESAAVRRRMRTVLGTEGPLPFMDQEFDSVLLSHVLEYVAHPSPLLKEIARVLKPGGSLLVMTPLGNKEDGPAPVHHFTGDSLTELLANYFEDLQLSILDERHLSVRCCKAETRRDLRISLPGHKTDALILPPRMTPAEEQLFLAVCV